MGAMNKRTQSDDPHLIVDESACSLCRMKVGYSYPKYRGYFHIDRTLPADVVAALAIARSSLPCAA